MRRARYSNSAPSNTVADRRRKMSVFDIFKMRPSWKWPLVDKAITTWKKLENILFSKEVEVRCETHIFCNRVATLLRPTPSNNTTTNGVIVLTEISCMGFLGKFAACAVGAIQFDACCKIPRFEGPDGYGWVLNWGTYGLPKEDYHIDVLRTSGRMVGV